MHRYYLFLSLLLILSSCSSSKKLYNYQGEDLLEKLMRHDSSFNNILQNKDSFNVQIIYTQINRDKNNSPSFNDFTFNLNKNNYFYPASTVKMPIAFLALEKLNELNIKGVNKYTAMLTDSSFDKQQIVYTQPNAEKSVPSIANYIKQIFLVSDNDAFNRLYEFLGQEYIQQKLTEKGYSDAIIRHRLNVFLTEEQNRHTNPVSFYDTAGKLLYAQASEYNKNAFPAFNAKLGKGFYRGSSLINEPFDFSPKNRVYLQDLHDILKAVLFPQSVNEKQKFNLTKDDYDFVYHWMSAYPKESQHPYYDSSYNDAYCKFLLYGAGKGSVNPNICIFNKTGDAYGFMIDVAYITDVKNNVEFMLCATISCNSDGIYNDDKYDYEKIGLPFMKNLGEIIYESELKRRKKHKPWLKNFEIDYQNKE
jgi:hypothetical protein